MGRIFIHIGLAKTATTTLQKQVFPSIDQVEVRSLGVSQPRTDRQSPEYRLRIDAINSGRTESARKWISQIMKANCSFLISEEGILVSDSHADWRSKRKNLAALVKGVDYE